MLKQGTIAYASAIWGERWQWRASEKSASHIFCAFLSPLRINIDNSVLIHPARILKMVSHFRDPSPHTSCLFIFLSVTKKDFVAAFLRVLFLLPNGEHPERAASLPHTSASPSCTGLSPALQHGVHTLTVIIPKALWLCFEELVKTPALPKAEGFVGVGMLHGKQAA